MMWADSLHVVAVTGGSGFLGSHLVRKLIDEGVEVHVPTTTKAGVPPRLHNVGGPLYLHHDVDLTKSNAACDLLSEVMPDAVFNLAAHGVLATQRLPERMTAVNTMAAGLLAEAVLRTGVGRFVHLGTGLEYGHGGMIDEEVPLNPASRYAATKAAATVLLRQLTRYEGLPAVIIRPFAAYGPAEAAEKFVPNVTLSALRDEPVRITHGLQIRQYLYVDDLVAGIWAAATTELPAGTELNLSGEESIQIRELAQLVVQTVGTDVPIQVGAVDVARPEPAEMLADTTKAREWLGWSPKVTLAEGLRRTVEWYRFVEELNNEGSS